MVGARIVWRRVAGNGTSVNVRAVLGCGPVRDLLPWSVTARAGTLWKTLAAGGREEARDESVLFSPKRAACLSRHSSSPSVRRQTGPLPCGHRRLQFVAVVNNFTYCGTLRIQHVNHSLRSVLEASSNAVPRCSACFKRRRPRRVRWWCEAGCSACGVDACGCSPRSGSRRGWHGAPNHGQNVGSEDDRRRQLV